MKLSNLLLLLFIITGLSTQAQTIGYGISPFTGTDNFYGLSGNLAPVKFNLQTGAVFSSSFNNGSLFTSYLASSFNQNLSKKFTLSAGAIISNSVYSNSVFWNSEGQLTPVSGNHTTFTLYTSGTYQVNDRLTVTGSAFKTINPAFNPRLNSDQLQMDARGMGLGVGYKVGENLHIGAEIRMQQGNGNFYNPYMNPFGNSFHPGFYGY